MFDMFMLGSFLGILKFFPKIKITSARVLARLAFDVVLDNNGKISSRSTPVIELKKVYEIITENWQIKS